jgi:probable phosphoglycerate mutase
MTRLYIVRHCEAEGNLYRRCHGQFDGLLTANGLRQRRTLETYFAGLPLDAVLSSDLKRAYATALAVAKPRNLAVETVRTLREQRLGAWEDLPWGEIAARYPAQNERFMRRKHLFTLEGAENFQQTQERLFAAVGGVARRYDGGTVALVTHGLALQILLARLLNIPPEKLGEVAHSDNGSVALVEWGQEPNVLFYGYNEHLGDLSTFATQHWWRRDAKHEDVNLRFAPDPGGDGSILALHKDRPAGTLRLGDADPVCGNIQHLEIVEELRGKGLGAQLLGEAISRFRAQGKTAVKLAADPGNSSARRFLEKLGFRPDGAEGHWRKSIVWDRDMEYV